MNPKISGPRGLVCKVVKLYQDLPERNKPALDGGPRCTFQRADLPSCSEYTLGVLKNPEISFLEAIFKSSARYLCHPLIKDDNDAKFINYAIETGSFIDICNLMFYSFYKRGSSNYFRTLKYAIPTILLLTAAIGSYEPNLQSKILGRANHSLSSMTPRIDDCDGGNGDRRDCCGNPVSPNNPTDC